MFSSAKKADCESRASSHRAKNCSCRDRQLGRTVRHRTSLRFKIYKNGNFLNGGQRFSPRRMKFSANLGISETNRRAKGPMFAGAFASSGGQKTETGLGGWRPSAVSTLLCLFSLLTGNFTGKFAKIGALAARETVESAVVMGLPKRIPYSTEQGIIFADRGILAREQGNFIGRKSPDFYPTKLPVLSQTPCNSFASQAAENRCGQQTVAR